MMYVDDTTLSEFVNLSVPNKSKLQQSLIMFVNEPSMLNSASKTNAMNMFSKIQHIEASKELKRTLDRIHNSIQ